MSKIIVILFVLSSSSGFIKKGFKLFYRATQPWDVFLRNEFALHRNCTKRGIGVYQYCIRCGPGYAVSQTRKFNLQICFGISLKNRSKQATVGISVAIAK